MGWGGHCLDAVGEAGADRLDLKGERFLVLDDAHGDCPRTDFRSLPSPLWRELRSPHQRAPGPQARPAAGPQMLLEWPRTHTKPARSWATGWVMGPLYLVLGCLAYGYPREASWLAAVYFATAVKLFPGGATSVDIQ